MVSALQPQRRSRRLQVINAAVLGSPIGHSLSPLLHKRAYEILGIPANYQAIELTPANAYAFFSRALVENWTGFSLTMPLKETIFDLTDELDFQIEPMARRIRSANTLIREGSTFRAISTDCSGFARLLSNCKKERVAIIGGGGTARAALGALDGDALEIDFLLRSAERSNLLSTIALTSKLGFFDMRHPLEGYDLVISTVPEGASDGIARILEFQIPVFCEVLYNPYPTELLAKAMSLGGETIDGMDLLVEQALDQIVEFSQCIFDFDLMRQELLTTGRRHLSQ